MQEQAREVGTRTMIDWLDAQGGDIAAAIVHRIETDAARIAELTDDRDEYARQVREHTHRTREAAWLTR